MSCDVGEVTESLENEQSSSLTSPGEPPMVQESLGSGCVKCLSGRLEISELRECFAEI